MARREIFAGNWKMFKTSGEAQTFFEDFNDTLKNENREIAIFPPTLLVSGLVEKYKTKNVDFGVQNMHFEEKGAFTGDVSPRMVKDSGVRYILIGHSERRSLSGETDEDVNKKMIAAFGVGVEPMLCVGELLDERESGKTVDVLNRQIKAAFENISSDQMKSVVVAYEPVWAIGTGKVATPEMAEDAHLSIRKIISELYSDEIASIVPILYGGSVKPENVDGLFEKENIDGALVGGASLEADSFSKIVSV